MIRLYIPSLYDSDFSSSEDMRQGDAQIIDDGTNYLVIDGYCGSATTRLIKRLKSRKVKSPYLLLTHPHYDHYYGIRKIIADKWFTPKMLFCQNPSTLRSSSNTNTLKAIISEAKARGIPVKYLSHKDHIVIGELDFYVYREQPEYDGNADAYFNDGSLCTYFKSIGYWTSGDGPQEIYTMCKKVGAKPKWFKIPHHGNNCPRSQSNGMKSIGAKICWDNDYATYITDFLRYGRNRCIEAGIRFLDIHGDINAIFFRKTAVIYKGDKIYRYSCSYNGKPTLKNHNADVVRLVLRGSYNKGDARTTMLLDDGYNPNLVQKSVNAVIRIAKGIKGGTLNYGKNEARIKKIDTELGTGYGQLVQDYINVLYKVRESV